MHLIPFSSKKLLPSVSASPPAGGEAVQDSRLPPRHTRGRLPEDGLAKTDVLTIVSVSKVTEYFFNFRVTHLLQEKMYLTPFSYLTYEYNLQMF